MSRRGQKGNLPFALTVEERILVHLHDYIRFRESWEVPYAVTQGGIAEAVSIRRPHISRAMKSFEEKGYIDTRQAHIKDHKRKRLVYFLNPTGVAHSQKVLKGINETKIKIKGEEGEDDEKEVGALVQEHGLSRLELLQLLDEEGAFDPSDVKGRLDEIKTKAQAPATPPAPPVVKVKEPLPTPSKFFGRADELERINEWVKGDSSKILVIHGIAGIGKTTLGIKVANQYDEKMNIFWHRFHEWETITNVLGHLANFLANLGRTRLSQYLSSGKVPDFNEISILLEGDFSELNALLFCDDFQKVRKKNVQLFKLILEVLERTHGVKAVIMARHIPPFYGRQDVIIKNLVTEVHLEGLDEESSKQLVSGKNFSELGFKKIYKLTRGHPLSLELMDTEEVLEQQWEVLRYIREEIFTSLSEEEKLVLDIASVYRYPVSSTVFSMETDIDPEVLDGLVGKSFLQLTPQGYDLHDLMRDFFYSRLPPTKRKNFHANATKFYTWEEGDIATIERQYHLIRSGELEQAASLAIEKGPDLIQRGFLEEFLLVLNELNEEDIRSQFWADILALRGKIYALIGRPDDAIEHLHRFREISEEIKSEPRIGRAYREIGHILREQNLWDVATENIQKALDISNRIDDVEGIVDSYYGLGWIHWKRGDFDQATHCMEESMRHAKRIEDNPSIARGQIGQGNINLDMGKVIEAIDNYNKSLDLATRMGHTYQIAEAHYHLGVVYQRMERFEDALLHFTEAKDVAEHITNIRMWGWALANLGHCQIRIKDYDEGDAALGHALEMGKKLGDKSLISTIHRFIGIGYREREQWIQAIGSFEESLGIIEKLDIPYDLAQTLFEYGMLHGVKGSSESALTYMFRSNTIFEKLGNKDMTERIKIEQKKLRVGKKD